jgi:Uri superfamily endonuclease
MIPAAPGTYVLVLQCSTRRTICIGRLGKLQLLPGYYLYVGSAFGPGGLRARVGHHTRRVVSPRWHIDYLRRYARLEAVWYASGARCEHEWAAAVGTLPGAGMVMRGFGSSDCGCETHLYWLAQAPAAAAG